MKKNKSRSLQSLIFLGGVSSFYETVEIVKDINTQQPTYWMGGILNDDPQLHGRTLAGIKVLGPLDMASDFKDALFIIGIGSYKTRLIRHEIIKRLNIPPECYASLIHPTAKIYPQTSIGNGLIIHSGVVILQETLLEDFVTILSNSVIGTNNFIGEGVLIAPLVVTTPYVKVGYYTHLGAACSIAESIKIGPGAQVGMGSAVFRNIPPGSVYIGNPPRVVNKVDVPDELLKKWETLNR